MNLSDGEWKRSEGRRERENQECISSDRKQKGKVKIKGVVGGIH